MKKESIYTRIKITLLLTIAVLAYSCSSTRNIPEGDQLYTGITKIEYKNYEKNDHFTLTKSEVEAALACAPNGALFGSSYYRTPFPYGLWIWNAFSSSNSGFSKWITKSLGKAPVLMSWVNPELRASIANSVLRNHGYFDGNVEQTRVQQKNIKKCKIGYTVSPNHLYTLDSIAYNGFPKQADSLIRKTMNDALIHKGDAFDVYSLNAERNRIGTLFRNNGYYYYQPGYSTYLADTLSVPGKVNLRFHMADDVPVRAKQKWYIGKLDVEIKKLFTDQLTDSIKHRRLTVHFTGRRPPIRVRVILKDMKIRPGKLFSYEDYLESANNVGASDCFSMTDFKFTPRDTTSSCDTLDMRLSCVLGKPYDFYVESNYINKTSGRTGPGIIVGFTKRNAFRGGEKLDINMHGSYEWQVGNNVQGSSSQVNSYEYGGDASLEIPRLMLPFNVRRRLYKAPTTLFKGSTNILNRAGYFRMHTVSGEMKYKFQTSATSIHEFSPLVIEYQHMNSSTKKFDSIRVANPYLSVSMQNQFIPKMKYTYTYISPAKYRNPIQWETTLTEAGNILSLGYLATGKKWNDKDKQMFKNPYAQFFKVQTDFRKTWRLGDKTQLVGHVGAGIIFSYGNSSSAPYNEQFYIGGANSVRAFSARSVGPGSYYSNVDKFSYVDQTGDMKILANIEYRFNIFGHLYGATFLDAGNIWSLKYDSYRTGSQFKLNNMLKEMATGTGIGLRYDLDFLIIRLDWGIGIHVPYDTTKSGYYNIPKFKDGQTLHFAVGYPF